MSHRKRHLLQLSCAHSLVCCHQEQSHSSVVTRPVIGSVVSYTSMVDDFLEEDSEFRCGVLLRGRKSRPLDHLLRAAEGATVRPVPLGLCWGTLEAGS